MIYLLVLFGSFLGICAILGLRIAFKNRSVRRFVRSISQRADTAEKRGLHFEEETSFERPKRDPRTSAIALQKLHSLTRQAEKAQAQRDFTGAESLYIQALTVSPDAYDVQAQLAKLYLETGREPKAEAMYRELLRNEEDVSFYANLGLAYYRQEKFTEACTSYKAALERDPKNPDRYAAVGRACMAAGNFADAAGALEHACTRLSRDTELLQLLGECLERLGKPYEAEEVYRRINKLEPYNEEVKSKLTQLAQA
jgi:Flp pilus assembly protein TadD